MFGLGGGLLQRVVSGMGGASAPSNPFASAVPAVQQNAPISQPIPVAFTKQTPDRGSYQSQIAQIAQEEGFDPRTVLRVVRSEGGFGDPFQHGKGPAPKSQAPGLGPTENSYGPLQLYISGTGAGLGDRALRAGIDPRKDWQAGLRYGLREVAQKGWGQWYGAKAAGVTGKMGYKGGGAGSPIGGPAIADASPAGRKAAPRGNQPSEPPEAGASPSFWQKLAEAHPAMPGNQEAAAQPDTSLRARVKNAIAQVQPAAPAELPQTAPAQRRSIPMPEQIAPQAQPIHQFLRSVSPVAMVQLAKKLNGLG